MHNFLKSIALLSLIPLSMTLASSVAHEPGGPNSNNGEAIGLNSAVTIITPSSFESG